MTDAALALERVTCSFAPAGRDQPGYIAVREATLVVGDGEFVAVVGPTGCGKSTLLNVAAGLLAPTSGSVTVFGETLVGINRRAGYLFQAEALMPWRSAHDNVTAGLEMRGLAKRDCLARADEWLRRVGLGG